jgi:predicted nucleic acid-binding protein
LIVVDASMTLAWLLSDERDARAESALSAVLERETFAPSIWVYEVTNALLVAERRRRLSRPVREMIADVTALGITVVEPRGFPVSEYALAVESDLSLCDSAYLHLAEERRATLATLDTRLADAAKRRNVAVFI